MLYTLVLNLSIQNVAYTTGLHVIDWQVYSIAGNFRGITFLQFSRLTGKPRKLNPQNKSLNAYSRYQDSQSSKIRSQIFCILPFRENWVPPKFPAIRYIHVPIPVSYNFNPFATVFWGGREGYQTLLNTDVKRELDHMGTFFKMAADYKKKIGFTGQLLIEPKPKEPMKHQYDYGESV